MIPPDAPSVAGGVERCPHGFPLLIVCPDCEPGSVPSDAQMQRLRDRIRDQKMVSQ
jgi:hypothetical protein